MRDADERGEQVHPGRDQRAVGDRQHQQRDDDAEHLRRCCRRSPRAPGLACPVTSAVSPVARASRSDVPSSACPLGVGDLAGLDAVGDRAVDGAAGRATPPARLRVQRVARARPRRAACPAGRPTVAHLRRASAGSVTVCPAGAFSTTCAVAPVAPAPNRSPISCQGGGRLLAGDGERRAGRAGQRDRADAGADQHEQPGAGRRSARCRADPAPMRERNVAMVHLQQVVRAVSCRLLQTCS